MRLSYNWLKEYLVDPPPPREIAERLTMSGTEIEGVTEIGADVSGVVTAEVVSCAKHPNADKLSLCEVRTDKEIHSIVCGARNMKPGDRVALALPGAELPGGVKIKKSRIRGIESGGMMCSEVELGLADTSEGIMILPPAVPLGVDINTALGLKDFVLEAAVTPNRADLLSIRGAAREIGAVASVEFRDKVISVVEEGPSVEGLVSIRVEATEDCRRYSARVITGVKIGPAPEHIKRRLEASGVRSINNVVDVTNYVLLELGQPLHAFDLDKIRDRKIVVRLSKDGESIETIDGRARVLPVGTLVIADSTAPVALAGVMGGKASEVSDSTVNILLESAWFSPSTVRRSSRKASLSTDSSYRFERGVDIETVTKALDMAAEMIRAFAGGTVAKGRVDAYPARFTPKRIVFDLGRASAFLGTPLEEGAVKGIFERLGARVERKAGTIEVIPPSYRMDLVEEADLSEEVARITGYDKIPSTLPSARLAPGVPSPLFEMRKRLREVLTDLGFFEVINYSFISREGFNLFGREGRPGVTILNPLTEEQAVMRDSLLPSLLDTLRKNLQRKNEEVRIFELSTVFDLKAGAVGEKALPEERWKIAGLMYGTRWGVAWNLPKEPIDFFDIKGVVERVIDKAGVTGGVTVSTIDTSRSGEFHPGKAATISIDGATAGVFGQIHPDLAERFDLKSPAFVFDLEVGALIKGASGKKACGELPKFPESTRDIAFVVDDTIPYMEILGAIRSINTKLIERVELFDVYYGHNIPAGKRSLALRVVYRSKEKTLTYEEVEAAHSKVSKLLSERFGAEVRGEPAGKA